MIRLRALRTLPFSFRSLSSVNGRLAIHRSPVFGSTQIRRFGSTRPSGLLDTEPLDNLDLFDVSLTDVNYNVLHGVVSEKLGNNYLSPAAKVLKPAAEINGVLFGTHHRPFFGLTATYGQSSYHLHFLFDTGSPFTYLSYEACNVLFKDTPLLSDFTIRLNGLTVLAHPAPATSHFKDVNLLGADFCALNGVRVIVDYMSKEAKLVFQDLQSE